MTGCTDINECLHPIELNRTYVKPTFRNLPGDDLRPTTSFYAPTLCTAYFTCINVFFISGVGFKCIDTSSAKVAVAIGGHLSGSGRNNKVDVLKADLTRCDTSIASFQYKAYWHEVS